MSNSSALPRIDQADASAPIQAPVYNLTVLIRQVAEDRIIARTANLELAEVESSSVRGALSKTVNAAKDLIRAKLSESSEIPWIDPPVAPGEAESRFVVPLHL